MLNHPLLDLQRFALEHPPQDLGEGALREKARHELYLQPGVRVRLVVDQAADIGYGLWRDEVLADSGLDAAELDSQAFAQQLTAALLPQLSLHNLEHLVEALSQALVAEQGDRAACAQAQGTRQVDPQCQSAPEAAFLEVLAQDI